MRCKSLLIAVGVLAAASPLFGQMAQDDIAVGLSTGATTYRVYDDSAGTWSNGPGWGPLYPPVAYPAMVMS